ncbi:PREDICTED: peptidyl-prolyl cis-trans isomerase FKBP17-2, chloroplastic-like [Tarenaya hassleriana]|uniref:peptidyl-prolyl cis-trans isomerase FKBP17-2, chloroplastic-like n=1 Tax=Tarenaya hassleriana TaxID=28532 RepID=UPI00053C6E5B|nr:PREDICTED: peptidyl-prolyl cis-trans isomerase FKBP17-2, chloroplastic-like [Tarenaya hassleriana]
MSSLFAATSASFISHSQPLNKLHNHLFASSSPPPPPNPESPPPSNPLSSAATEQQSPAPIRSQQQKRKTSVETTDWVASSLTRRFGIGAGLAWAAFLAVGVVSEQIKTRLEVSKEKANTRDVDKQEEIVLPNGVRYYDLRVGGGANPRPGDLVVIDLKGQVQGTGEVFLDTFESKDKKPLVLVMGSRPYTKGMCQGLEYVLRSMKAGGKRRVIVPPSLGFGENGSDLGPGLQIPPSATLEYVVEVDKVSIAPA